MKTSKFLTLFASCFTLSASMPTVMHFEADRMLHIGGSDESSYSTIPEKRSDFIADPMLNIGDKDESSYSTISEKRTDSKPDSEQLISFSADSLLQIGSETESSPRNDSSLSGADPIETRSILSMHELDPSPVDDYPPDVENGDYFPDLHNTAATTEVRPVSISRLGLKGHNWDYWLSAIQRYSTYPPTVFFALHAANTSLIPLVTRSVPSSEDFLLLTRPIYQSPSLEPLMVALPIVAHIASGLSLRSIRARRRARLYGAESRSQRQLIKSWPMPSLQAKLGYAMVPLVALHVGVNRAVPLQMDGGSSSVGLGYVAHGFARSPVFWNMFYFLFVATSVWHLVGGLATWMGIRVTTVRTERGQSHKTGIIGESRHDQQKRRKNKWLVHGIAALATAIWLAGGLGVVGRGGIGSGWEAKNWDQLYKSVPVVGAWL
ncbi:hypothetical protein PISL3812_05752 [Talaromyces islandicus]|uniref:Mitochondrial adapter protein MCP1 transmembrane domain-containing protein n=1 Tax=Talaromyces islandicus TaxID=28573 RepID=A0A0U1LZI1_TALIS|nr:hypothetical protein PISL3812_05752 [Talaromyces islandicus]